MWQVTEHMYDRQLDQSTGDTCHHCKGDMWHGMTSATDWADTWQSHRLTAGQGTW
jgi:hypothetical protein